MSKRVDEAVITVEPERSRRRSLVSRMVPWRSSTDEAEVMLDADVDSVVVRSSPRFDLAKERLAPHLVAAKGKVGPAAEQAAERARQMVLQDVIPQMTAAMTAAATASEPYRQEAQRRSRAAAAALRGVELEPVEPEKKHRLRNLLLLLGLGGIAAAVYRWMSGNDAESSWQEAYEPTPAQPQTPPMWSEDTSSESTSTMGRDPSDPLGEAPTDAAAAGPDEALADLSDEPHSATSPDSPLMESDLPPPPDGVTR